MELLPVYTIQLFTILQKGLGQLSYHCPKIIVIKSCLHTFLLQTFEVNVTLHALCKSKDCEASYVVNSGQYRMHYI